MTALRARYKLDKEFYQGGDRIERLLTLVTGYSPDRRPDKKYLD
jgi:hypothetical protein